MRTTACKNISQYNTTAHRAKPTINPLSIATNRASRYSFSSETALGNPWPIGAAALHDSTISVDRPVWSLSPLSAALPESPPPICSDCSSPPRSSATIFYSLAPTVLSTSRFQSARSNFSKPPVSSNIEIEECVQSGKNLNGFHRHTDDGIATQNCPSKYRSRQSAVADAEVHSRTSSSFLDDDNEKKHGHSDPKCNYSINSSDADSVDCGNHKLMTRPKPYSDFLDEIKAPELEAQMGAWKKAKHRELMNKLRRNEAVIRDWEYKQTHKALKDMRKVENKLERKRAEALERAQKRINKARKEANEERNKNCKRI
ncbi:PREDICTED: uncharacterized protein LOC105131845 isoform X2 [Populus euphratica]|uniref:Uncharacterized protein LOC105131845 isoform X2 n=1 Tax=Populus euphratica TaxID=75702 RepID=A0AAJ6UQY9_POPEU|nr:PREDICTED: uncharacterized protein LOC105131845 isoform X2 [Populus euphratica]